jgi:hypothetical protein
MRWEIYFLSLLKSDLKHQLLQKIVTKDPTPASLKLSVGRARTINARLQKKAAIKKESLHDELHFFASSRNFAEVASSGRHS